MEREGEGDTDGFLEHIQCHLHQQLYIYLQERKREERKREKEREGVKGK